MPSDREPDWTDGPAKRAGVVVLGVVALCALTWSGTGRAFLRGVRAVVDPPVHLVDVNDASEAELAILPGIGPSRARAIAGGRPFGSIEELTRVSGIGPRTVERIRNHAHVGPVDRRVVEGR